MLSPSTAPSCGASCLPIKIRDRSFALLSDRNLSTPHGRTSSLKRYRFNKTLNLPCLAICRRRQKQRYSPLRSSRFWKLSVKFTRICFVGLCNGITKKRGEKLFPYYRPAAVYRDTTRWRKWTGMLGWTIVERIINFFSLFTVLHPVIRYGMRRLRSNTRKFRGRFLKYFSPPFGHLAHQISVFHW